MLSTDKPANHAKKINNLLIILIKHPFYNVKLPIYGDDSRFAIATLTLLGFVQFCFAMFVTHWQQ